MSEIPRWAAVCEQERTVTLDPSSVCSSLQTVPVSPIDDFYTYLASLIPLGSEQGLRDNGALGKVLLLGIVSATEHYFRAALSGLVDSCPLVRKKAAALPLSFGALDYYLPKDLGLALLENVSLATAGEVRKQTQRVVGIDTHQDLSTDAALSQYEKVCQLRHAAAHARGDLGHQNLQELGVSTSGGRLALTIEFSAFHAAAAVCQNVVRSYNRLLYRKSVERWMTEKVLSGRWEEDRVRFSALYDLFYSGKDSLGPSNAYHAYRNLLPTLRKVLRTVKLNHS